MNEAMKVLKALTEGPRKIKTQDCLICGEDVACDLIEDHYKEHHAG